MTAEELLTQDLVEAREKIEDLKKKNAALVEKSISLLFELDFAKKGMKFQIDFLTRIAKAIEDDGNSFSLYLSKYRDEKLYNEMKAFLQALEEYEAEEAKKKAKAEKKAEQPADEQPADEQPEEESADAEEETESADGENSTGN